MTRGPALVRMPVVQIRVVRVGVRQWRVPVGMHMRLPAVPTGIVRMLVVRVMRMLVAVRQFFVHVRVLMVL